MSVSFFFNADDSLAFSPRSSIARFLAFYGDTCARVADYRSQMSMMFAVYPDARHASRASRALLEGVMKMTE